MKNMKVGILRYLLFITFISFFSCKKTEDKPPKTDSRYKISFNMHYNVDGAQLQKDTILYSNEAGNKYSVTRLEYYISAIKLHKAGGDFENADVHYINFKKTETNNFILADIPEGEYTGISLLLGLDSAHNKSNALAPTQENNGMSWPDMMGGGYHFMKLEGHYKDTDPNAPNLGYAIHLGRNMSVVRINKQMNFSLKADKTLNLSMNINEWYKNPYIYDFNVDGNYSMNINTAMAKLAANGADVFTFSFE